MILRQEKTVALRQLSCSIIAFLFISRYNGADAVFYHEVYGANTVSNSSPPEAGGHQENNGWVYRYMHDEKEKKAAVDTTALYENLFKADSLDQFIQTNTGELQIPQFHLFITELCKTRGEVPERVIKRGGIENSFGHQLFSGRRKPSRDTVIQLAFGFEADVELAQTLLKYARRSQLYPRIKRDAAILYCLYNHLSFLNVQEVLYDLGLPLLGESRT